MDDPAPYVGDLASDVLHTMLTFEELLRRIPID
jgi:hypothetical protein